MSDRARSVRRLSTESQSKQVDYNFNSTSNSTVVIQLFIVLLRVGSLPKVRIANNQNIVEEEKKKRFVRSVRFTVLTASTS